MTQDYWGYGVGRRRRGEEPDVEREGRDEELERLRNQDRLDYYAMELRPHLESLIEAGHYTKAEANRILDMAEQHLTEGRPVEQMPLYEAISSRIPKEGMRAAQYLMGKEELAGRETFTATEKAIALRGVRELESMMQTGAEPKAVRAAKTKIKGELTQLYMKYPEFRLGWADDWNRAGKVLFDVSSPELREYTPLAFPSDIAESRARTQDWFKERYPTISGVDRGGRRTTGRGWRDIFTGSGRYAPKIRTIKW